MIKGIAYTVIALSQASGFFRIAGDHRTDFPFPAIVRVANSTGNDRIYHCFNVTLLTGQTRIWVSESIPSATADGVIFSSNVAIAVKHLANMRG